MKKDIYKRAWICLLTPVAFLLSIIAKHNSDFVEHIFSLRIYKWVSTIISCITGWFPYSFIEIFLVIIIFCIPIICVKFCVKLFKAKIGRRVILLQALLNVLCILSILYFSFVVCCSMNYHRYSISYYADLEIEDSSISELYDLCEELVYQANDLREKLGTTDNYGAFRSEKTKIGLSSTARVAYKSLSDQYDIFNYKAPKPKPLFLSKLLSYAEITGIFIPFTMEANINIDIPQYSIPSTMCHELAHFYGFMREDEANYISYMACMASDDIEFQYSGTMEALILAGNQLYNNDKEKYMNIRELYSDGVMIDLQRNSVYWSKYDNTTVSTISNKVNDTYLKANKQEDGVQSYGRMVDLLLAGYKKNRDMKYDK